MKIKLFSILSAILCLTSCESCCDNDLTQFVNPKIGSGGHGHVFVGANVPFGMVQLGPTSIPQSWDWCSGYHESDSTVIGFSHTHLQGTGIGDLFDITVMPTVGDIQLGRGTVEDILSGQGSYADRSQEISVPGYYSVPLLRYGVKAEMTATERVGFHRYTFPKSDQSSLVFDLQNGGCWDKSMETGIEIVDDQTIKGYRFSKGWANNQKIFFYARFSKAFDSEELVETELPTGKCVVYGKFNFKTAENEQVLLKVALSPVSTEGAQANMEAELDGWDFDLTVSAAKEKWNQALGRICIETSDPKQKTIFYTAMYHSQIHPALFCDVNQDYRGADDRIYNGEGKDTYTIFSLWDTYRAEMPLLCIMQPERMESMIHTLLSIHEQQGKLPVWHLMGCETDCMVGNPGVIATADALVKGFCKEDREKAFDALKTSSLLPDRGQDLRMKYGFIPSDQFMESVAYDMEYAIADAAVANVAELIGNVEDTRYFRERSHSYRNYFDKGSLFFRGKKTNGEFTMPFNPYASSHRSDDYCEGNAWQYSWLMPHDFEHLTEMLGGTQVVEERLDSLFNTRSDIEGANASPDVSGLIGQYAHGNEPSHHIIYFYTMAGLPWKSADRVREVLNTMYTNTEQGLPGNEDEGQMSAWYILSSLGFYQVEPASTHFWFGSPSIKKADLKVSGGTFRIITENNSEKNRYIQSIQLNGEDYTLPYLDYNDIVAGGELVIRMGAEKTKWF